MDLDVDIDYNVDMANYEPVSSTAMSMDWQVSQAQAVEELLDIIGDRKACHTKNMQTLAQQAMSGFTTFNMVQENSGINFGKWNSRPINKVQGQRTCQGLQQAGSPGHRPSLHHSNGPQTRVV